MASELLFLSIAVLFGLVCFLLWRNMGLKNALITANAELRIIKDNEKILTTQFQNIAHEIINKSAMATHDNQQNKLHEILAPFAKNITELQSKIDLKFTADGEKIKELAGFIQGLNTASMALGMEAKNLSDALKNNKIQGNWGEMLLERILEDSGLVKNIHFESQVALMNDDNQRYIPDIRIKLPDDKIVIIDSKVNLIDYQRFVVSGNEEDSRNHLKAIKNQINNLSEKPYQKLAGNNADLVMMFIPIESAFYQAIQADNELMDYALKRKIFIVSPSTIMLSLKLIHQLWQNDKIAKNSQEIARLGGALYDKLAGFVDDFIKIGNQLQTTRGTFEAAENKLRSGKGNALKIADDLKNAGAKAQKNIAITNDEIVDINIP